MSNLCVTGDTLIDIVVNSEKISTEIKNLSFYIKKYKNVKVKSFDLKNQKIVYSEIVDFAQTGESFDLIEIEDEEGNILKCTPDHLIYTQNRGYVRADELNEKDVLKNVT
jgi:intein/homing endonuclease